MRHILASITFLCLLSPATLCSAATISWQFTGEVRFFQSGANVAAPPASLVAAGVVAGAPISGFYTLDTSTVDSDPDTERGQYDGAILAAEMTVGSLTITLDTSGPLNTVIPTTQGPSHRMLSFFSAPDSGGVDVFFGFLEWVDSDKEIFASDAFPSPPPLELLDPIVVSGITFNTSVGFAAEGVTVRAEILTLNAVPEPSVTGMVGFGLLLLGANRSPRRSFRAARASPQASTERYRRCDRSGIAGNDAP